MAELNPCPFCGGEAKFITDKSFIQVVVHAECHKCGSRGSSYMISADYCAKDIVAEQWNTRVYEPEARVLTVEELRGWNGEKIWVKYIGNCEGLCRNILAPYYGKYEQYISEYNGMLKATDLSLQYYNAEWLAYDRQPKEG